METSWEDKAAYEARRRVQHSLRHRFRVWGWLSCDSGDEKMRGGSAGRGAGALG